MNHTTQPGRARAWALLILGIIYLALVGATFAFGISLAVHKPMQIVLHITVILSAIAYLLFADALYAARADKTHARPALLFAALFTVAVIAGRCTGLAALSSGALFTPDGVFNFYAAVSLTRSVEMAGWTVLYPLSMLFFSRMFLKERRKTLAVLSGLSALCCLIAFFCFVSPSMVFLYIGLLGWGPLFLAVVAASLPNFVRQRE